MKVTISEIPEEGQDLEQQALLKFNDSFSSVRARLRIEKVGTEVSVRGDIMTDVELKCGRCLKNFRYTFTIPVEVVYHPVQEFREEDKHELRGEELDMDFYSGDELDLFDLIKEQVTLNLPMKPLCNPLCKGICLKCGVDLNEGTCTCSEREIDPRLKALEKLLDK